MRHSRTGGGAPCCASQCGGWPHASPVGQPWPAAAASAVQNCHSGCVHLCLNAEEQKQYLPDPKELTPDALTLNELSPLPAYFST